MFSVVPTGLVDSRMTRLPGCRCGAMAATAALTAPMSGLRFSSMGVGTAMRKMSAGPASTLALSWPAVTALRTITSRSGSTMWI